MTVRVYVHWLDDRRGMRWSVDLGTQDTERNVRGVRVHGASGLARVDMRAKRAKGQPNAWLEYRGVRALRVTPGRVAHIYGSET